ncbi:MAG: ribonuclease HIII [Bacilli bacterium]
MKENVSFVIDKEVKELMEKHYSSYKTAIKGDYVVFSASLNSSLTLIIYSSKKGYKAYFSGIGALQEARYWDKKASLIIPKEKERYEWINLKSQIGSDEVGTGDFFGPVIVVAAFVKEEQIDYLHHLGVDDSKKLSDKKILEIVPSLLNCVTYSMLCLDNITYNQQIEKGESMNSLKAILHNRALLNVEKKINAKNIPLFIDQFCEEDLFFHYCRNQKEIIKGATFKTKGESFFPSVAVASLIARYTFLKKLEELSNIYQMSFPKGASLSVDEFASSFIKKYSKKELYKVCKTNFINYSKL